MHVLNMGQLIGSPWYTGWPHRYVLYHHFQYIHIRNNPIRHVNPAAFRGIHVKTLSISNGQLKYFPLIDRYCTDLDKSNWNQSTHINDTHSLCGWDELKGLRLFNNQLTAVPDLGFLQFQLVDLGLGFNRISSISNMCKINYTSLKNLHLNDNRINSVNFACFVMPRLENVLLNRNSLQFIEDMSMSTLGEYLEPGHHTSIRLSINPFHCSTNLSWIFEALHKDDYIRGVYFYQRETNTPILHNIQQMRCHTPRRQRGRFVIDLGM